jgi:hypothetical protein
MQSKSQIYNFKYYMIPCTQKAHNMANSESAGRLLTSKGWRERERMNAHE